MARVQKNNDVDKIFDALARALDARIDLSHRSGTLRDVTNKRKAGQEFVGGYMSKKLKAEFKKVAKKEAGGNAKKLLIKFVIEGLKKRGVDVEDDRG